MQEHHTTDSEYSSLPTPKARDSQPEGYEAGLRRATPQVGTIVKALVDGDERILMPTPNTMDFLQARTPEQKAANKGKGGYANVRETVINDLLPTTRAQEPGSTSVGYGDSLNDFASRVATGYAPKDLIPTPTTRDYKDGSQPHERDGVVQTDTVARAVFNSGEIQLPTPTASDWKGANHSGSGSASSRGMATVVEQTNWGKFEPAIRRWEETLGRPAPAPTKADGKEGSHRLSSAFTEWMMGLPNGWITDVGLSRNDELKACGNGVVPQQAELALRVLLQGVPLPAGGGASESSNSNS